LFFDSDAKSLQSIHYLEYKKRIEIKLNETLSSFTSRAAHGNGRRREAI